MLDLDEKDCENAIRTEDVGLPSTVCGEGREEMGGETSGVGSGTDKVRTEMR
jgi:hypothetical protein